MQGVSRPGSGADLYGLPLERFTDERNALVKRLRSDGRRETAAQVARLRRPSAAAWAVNQLVRTQKREIDALFKAGDALQRAQAAVLSGRADPGFLREAAEAERAALDALAVKARGLLSSEGHELSPAKLEQVSETLHAAAIDAEARERVRDACLQRELRHAGLGGLGAGGTSTSRSRARTQPARDERARKLKSARQAAAEARRAADRASRAVRGAEERRERAAAQLREAERALARAQALAEETARVHERARRTVEEL